MRSFKVPMLVSGIILCLCLVGGFIWVCNDLDAIPPWAAKELAGEDFKRKQKLEMYQQDLRDEEAKENPSRARILYLVEKIRENEK